MEKFKRDTDVALIKQALEEKGAFCDHAEDYFNQFKDDGYGAVVDSLSENIKTHTDITVNNIHSLLSNISSQTSIEINDFLLHLILDYNETKTGIGNGRTLTLWRKIKDLPTISNHVKERMINSITGELPYSEDKTDLMYTDTLGKLVKV